MLKPVATTALAAMTALSGLTGCATTGSRALDRANAQCVATILIGGVVGAAIGNNTGSGNAGRGAAIGLAAGGAACLILQAMATEEDRRRIAALEAEALEAGEFRQASYVVNGKARTVQIHATPASDPLGSADGGGRQCRNLQTVITVQDIGSHNFGDEMVCRNPETLAWERVQA